MFAVQLATDVASLNASLKRNRPAIDRVHAKRPDLWQRLKDYTQQHRRKLEAAGKLDATD